MNTILVIDDAMFCREMVARALRMEGYQVLAAAGAQEGLDLLDRHDVRLIILDQEMPGMDGLAFLQRFSARPEWRAIPIIMLTGVSEKDIILAARGLGASEYLLKSTFSADVLLSRVRKHVQHVRPRPAVPAVAATPAPRAAITPAQVSRGPCSPAVSRKVVLAAIENMEGMKTLAGIIQKSLAFADSSKSSLQELSALIRQDAVLTARVFQIANSAAFSTTRGRVMTLDDAIRNIGTGSLRAMVLSYGVMEAFSTGDSGDLGLLRCWRHSLAVAMLMDRFLEGVDEIPPGIAYMVGLLHDLGEIVLRQRFTESYHAAEQVAAADHVTVSSLWRDTFGISAGEFAAELLRRLPLPVLIAKSIGEFADRQGYSAAGAGILSRAFRAAELHANGMLMTSTPEVFVAPLEPIDWRGLNAPPLNADIRTIRSDVLAASIALARVSPTDDAVISRPLLPALPLRVAYYRSPSLSPSDPVENALRQLCEPAIFDGMPDSIAPWTGCEAVIMAGPTLESVELERIARALPTTPMLLLTRQSVPAAPSSGSVTFLRYPVMLRDVHDFLRSTEPAAHTVA